MEKELSKEEIINKYWKNPTDLLSEVPKMMDVYATQEKKKEAIAFLNWVENDYGADDFGNREFEDEDLYQLYCEQNKQLV